MVVDVDIKDFQSMKYQLQKALQDNETITQQLHQSNESTSILKENIEVLQKKLEEAVILKTEVVTKKDEVNVL